jgi:hypothetical protein
MTRSNWASAYAIRPSSENLLGSKGSLTLSIPALSFVGLNSELLSFATASSTVCLFSDESSR